MRLLWRVMLTIGVLLFLISLTADSLGIGEGTGIGWKQISGAVAGVLLAAAAIMQLGKATSG
jgi:hypothetical protein